MSGNISSYQNGTQPKENIVHLRMRLKEVHLAEFGIGPSTEVKWAHLWHIAIDDVASTQVLKW